MPSNPTPKTVKRVNEAIEAMRNRDFNTAAGLFDRLGKFTLENHELAKAAGFANYQLRQAQRALNYFKASLSGNKAQPDVQAAMGDIYVSRGDQQNAIEHIRAAITLVPDEPELQYKLALALIRFDRYEDALVAMQAALGIDPSFVKAKVGLGRVLTELEQFDEAEQALNEAQEIAPDNYAVDFRFGKLREKQLRYEEALSFYRAAAARSGNAAEVYEATGLCELAMLRPEDALKSFEKGMASNPVNLAILAHDSNLRYELDDPEPFRFYERVLDQHPDVYAEYIDRLILAGRSDDASGHLERFEAAIGVTPQTTRLRALLHYAMDDFATMNQVLASVPDDHLDLLTLKARALMGSGDLAGAQRILERIHELDPLDQYARALLTTCYRVKDPDAYEALVHYDQFIIRTELDVPDGYRDIHEFNAELLAKLRELHVTRHNPLSQSVLGGTQTPGNLLLNPDTVIQKLRGAIDSTLQRVFDDAFFAGLPDGHPVKVASGHALYPQAAWSIWVTEGGHHIPHVHSRGWYSSAYYVSVPEVVKSGSQGDEGALAFGRPGTKTRDDIAPDRIYTPAEGILTLFPSFVWHETLAYKSEEPRVVVAFDAVPRVPYK